MTWFLLLLLYMGSSSVLANLSRRDSSLDLKQWSVGHEANDDHLLRLSIILTIQDDDLGVQTLLRISDPASPDYGQYMSAKEVARMFAPSPNTVSDVMEWLEDSGIDAAQVNLSHTGDRMSLDLSVQKATLLLGTTFYHQTHKRTGQERVAFQHYHIPQSLSGSIEYIHAVSSVSVQQQLAHRRPIGNDKVTTAATPPSASLTHQQIPQHQLVLNDRFTAPGPLPPNCLQQTTLSCLRILYGIPDNVSPHINNSLGVYEPSWISWLEEDLDKFFGQHQKNLVGHRPKVDAINGGYLQRNYTGSVWNQEPNLDFEYTMALTSPQEVTNIQVGSYEQSGNLNDMLAAFDEYYCDHLSSGYTRDPPIYPPGCNATSCDCGSSSAPKVVSISWGWTEADFAAKYLQRQCLEFLKLGLMGTTVVVSVSDHGTASEGGHFCVDDPTGNATGGRFSPTFPSSCPWVTTVGGTQMLQPTSLEAPGTIANETAFRKVIAGTLASSGGGFSNVFRAPPYQALQVASYQDVEKEHLGKIQDCFSSAGRGYPDVAARADDYLIVSNGQWKLTSGTSASNPVFASIITLINSERMHRGKGSVGFINPVLYSNPDILNDIVTGANQGCGIDQAFRATRGWDAVTGLGSPDYQRMRRLFLDLP